MEEYFRLLIFILIYYEIRKMNIIFFKISEKLNRFYNYNVYGVLN